MQALRGNALIGQSGGPTAVINQSLVGLVEGCVQSAHIEGVYGARNGIQGVLDGRLVDLGRERPEDLERVAATPCAALGSVRRKPDRETCARLLSALSEHDVRYFFYIGGNDSAEAAHLLNEVAVGEGYDVRLFHVPKTIDNDLCETDHCPGYGSAARFVAQAVAGDNEDNRSLGGIKLDVIMGRNAGWLTASSALARAGEDDGPHLIYLPEVDFTWEGFLADIERVMSERGRCVVAVSEGIHDAGGELIAKVAEQDAFGNVQLSGSGFLGDLLASKVRQHVGPKIRLRADTFGYLQRSFFGCVSEQDAREAREVGRFAVQVATSGDVPHGSLVILRDEEGGHYRPRYGCAPLEKVARVTRSLPPELLRGNSDVAPGFLDYVRPLAGPLQVPGRLSYHPLPTQA